MIFINYVRQFIQRILEWVAIKRGSLRGTGSQKWQPIMLGEDIMPLQLKWTVRRYRRMSRIIIFRPTILHTQS